MLSHINVGSGTDISIMALARMIADITGFTGRIEVDTTKPDGAARKLMDVTRLSDMGWRARIDLRTGIEDTYKWFLSQEAASLRT